MNIEELREKLISLPFVSETRVPYTYHHDYVREFVKKGSRSDVAGWYKGFPDEQFYAGTVLFLLRYHGIDMIKAFKEDIYDLSNWALDTFTLKTS